MTHRLEVHIDDLKLVSFHVSKWNYGPSPAWISGTLTREQLHRIIDLLTLIADDPKKQNVVVPARPTETTAKTPEPKPANTSTSPSSPLPEKDKARQFARELLKSGVPLGEARKQTEDKFGMGACRMGRWRGWCNVWRVEGILPKLPERPTAQKDTRPPVPKEHLTCKRIDVSHLSEADCVEFQTRWNFSTANPRASWDKLTFCHICPNEKKREELEKLRRHKDADRRYALSGGNDITPTDHGLVFGG